MLKESSQRTISISLERLKQRVDLDQDVSNRYVVQRNTVTESVTCSNSGGSRTSSRGLPSCRERGRAANRIF